MYSILDRKTFYQNLVEEILVAKTQIVLDAYIWINDDIGNKVAEALLQAANKGVKVFIRKDLSASIFEHTPKRTPFFIRKKDLGDWKTMWSKKQGIMTAKMFNIFAFHIYGKRRRPVMKENPLLERILEHKNIFIEHYPFFNHGKLILIDDLAYVGGQCISNDYTQWIDYNVKIKDTKVVQNIYAQIKGGEVVHKGLETHFVHNLFAEKEPIHLLLKRFIDEVPGGEELIIEMSYFGKWFIPILKKALRRNVKLTIVASKESDTNHHTNMWVLSSLLKLKSPCLKVFLSDTMIHTKGLSTRWKVMMGAANFHNACGYFRALNEQNILSKNKALVATVLSRFKEDIEAAKEITSHADLPKWKRRSALTEIVSVYVSSYFIFLNKNRIQGWRDRANEKIAHLQ